MSVAVLALHFFHVALPALALALWMPLMGHWVLGSSRTPWHLRAAVHAVLGVGVMCAGLVLWRTDGQMATYGALVLALATAEWWMQRR